MGHNNTLDCWQVNMTLKTFLGVESDTPSAERCMQECASLSSFNLFEFEFEFEKS